MVSAHTVQSPSASSCWKRPAQLRSTRSCMSARSLTWHRAKNCATAGFVDGNVLITCP
jgi:hypothetical protein